MLLYLDCIIIALLNLTIGSNIAQIRLLGKIIGLKFASLTAACYTAISFYILNVRAFLSAFTNG